MSCPVPGRCVRRSNCSRRRTSPASPPRWPSPRSRQRRKRPRRTGSRRRRGKLPRGLRKPVAENLSTLPPVVVSGLPQTTPIFGRSWLQLQTWTNGVPGHPGPGGLTKALAPGAQVKVHPAFATGFHASPRYLNRQEPSDYRFCAIHFSHKTPIQFRGHPPDRLSARLTSAGGSCRSPGSGTRRWRHWAGTRRAAGCRRAPRARATHIYPRDHCRARSASPPRRYRRG